VVEAVAHHHERWDGKGYPGGLPGVHTPLMGRIMQIADAASAMRLDRPYRRGMSRSRVIAELRAGAGTQFDPALVEPFTRVIGRYVEEDRSA
jgi:HD-GYP domain-containing protein (c-di-GMP phosphodiesterase class II)